MASQYKRLFKKDNWTYFLSKNKVNSLHSHIFRSNKKLGIYEDFVGEMNNKTLKFTWLDSTAEPIRKRIEEETKA